MPKPRSSTPSCRPGRDTLAAQKLMRKLLKRQGIAPTEWVTDKYQVYAGHVRPGQAPLSTGRPGSLATAFSAR